MDNKTVRDIKRSQKESVFYKHIAQLFLQISQENERLHGLSVNRVQLSPDKSVCSVLFYSTKGKAFFDERMEDLILYKPSLRSAIAKAIPSRYVPKIVFKYDSQFEKQIEIESLLDKVKV